MIFLLLNYLIHLLQLLVFLRAAMTWFMPNPPKAIAPVTNAVDSLIEPFRVEISVNRNTRVDLGPMLLLILLEVIRMVLVSLASRGFAF